jgi:antibiotic biosynthesis monooxygenase (ABM) superfamily enzyme
VVSGGAPSKETMTNETSTTNTPERLTVIVSRRIRPGRETEFEKTMQSFVQFALRFPGRR